MQRERFIPCQTNAEDCKYSPNCFVSEHHIYPRRTAETKLQRAFGNLACNKVTACRAVHDVLDTFPEPAYPNALEMSQVVSRERGKEWK